MDGYDDFSEASEQEHFELDANDADAPVVASDSKQEGQRKQPSPAALNNTAQSSPATINNKVGKKQVQIADAASDGGESNEDSQSATGSPSTEAPTMQPGSVIQATHARRSATAFVGAIGLIIKTMIACRTMLGVCVIAFVGA